MYEWGQNIKKRRARQIQSIQHGELTHEPYFPKEWEVGEQATLWKSQSSMSVRKKRWMRKLTIQSIFSFMLLVGTYLILQNDSVRGQRAQELVNEAMNRPFNFQGMTAWYEQHIGASPTFLPVFRSETKTKWIRPVSGEIILPFNPQRNGIVIRTTKDAHVVAPADGWVTFVGEKEGIGRTVILQHENGSQIWLSLLGTFQVKKNQWVKKGEPIGVAGFKSGQPLVYVAVRQDGKFLNPNEVISFD